MAAWAIKDWSRVFENYRSREIKGPLTWVAFPIRQDSEGFVTLMRLPNGLETFAVFTLLVQVAARCPQRGVLSDDKGEITPERFARRFSVDPEVIRKAFEALSSTDIGWLVRTDASCGCTTAHDGAPTGRATPVTHTRPDPTDRTDIPEPGNPEASKESGSIRKHPEASQESGRSEPDTQPEADTDTQPERKAGKAPPVLGSGGSKDTGWGNVNPATAAKLSAAGGTPERFRALLAERRGDPKVRNPLRAALGLLAAEVGVSLNGSAKPRSQFALAIDRAIQNRSPR